MWKLIPRDLNCKSPEVAQPGSPVRTSALLRLLEVRRLPSARPGGVGIGTRAAWSLDVLSAHTRLAAPAGTARPLMGATLSACRTLRFLFRKVGQKWVLLEILEIKWVSTVPRKRFPYVSLPKCSSHYRDKMSLDFNL